MSWASSSRAARRAVDVVMNGGKDTGSYLLMEQIRVGENRLELDTPKKKATDPKDITGDYFVQYGL